MITAVSGSSGISAVQSSESQSLGQDVFLNLLVTQLKHQDPLNPMEATEFVSQLAQFSELDEMRKISSGQEDLSYYLASLNNFSALGLLGKEVEFSGNTFSHQADSPSDLAFSLGADASKVEVRVYDSQGRLVATLRESNLPAGRQSIAWNGRDDSTGAACPSGTYRFEVSATDAEGKAIPAATVGSGTVEEVVFQNGTPYLYVGGLWVALDDIQRIRPQG